jgi:protein-S-isoprenylcysteine O-methyltransferase Ste14
MRPELFYEHAIDMLWIAWLIYWCAAAFTTKPTRRRESVASRLLHLAPLYLGVALLLLPRLPLGWLNMRFLPWSSGWYFLGFALVVLGLGFSVLARVWLGGNWSGTVTLKQDHQLIRRGPYRWVRHPIYTGLLLALLGSAIAQGEWRGLLAVALITLSFLRKITIEERFLTEQFGEAYTLYRAEVPALVPLWR